MTAPDPKLDRKLSWAWRAGQIVQGGAMGLLLFLAILGLIGLAGNVPVFRYQGY